MTSQNQQPNIEPKKSTFAPFTTMDEISDPNNPKYVAQYIEKKTKAQPDQLHPRTLADVCSKAIIENNEELFWRSWATLAQALSIQPVTCNVTNEEKTKILSELGSIGGQNWGHEGIMTPHFH